jgi:peptidyl-prolyl cis-trans isomerase C
MRGLLISRRAQFVVLNLLLTGASLTLPLRADKKIAGKMAVQVGSVGLSKTEVAAELARLPSYQLQALAKGGDPRRQLVERSLVPSLLYAQEARHKRLGKARAVADARRQVLVEVLHEELERQIEAQQPVTDSDVKSYRKQHAEDYETPPRIRIWRILTEDKKLAASALTLGRKSDGVAKWRSFAREHSVDRATRMRGGDIGFVRPDGNTDVPRVRVPKTLYEHAEKLQEGELLAEPIAEGKYFAAVWRRGSLPAESRDPESVILEIRALIAEQRLAEKRVQLLSRLRKEYVTEAAPDLLEQVALPKPRDFTFAARTSPAPQGSARASVQKTEFGLR